MEQQAPAREATRKLREGLGQAIQKLGPIESYAERPLGRVVWAVDYKALTHRTFQILANEGEPAGGVSVVDTERTLLNRGGVNGDVPARPVLVAVRPTRINERLSVQQGFFLYSDPRTVPFETCLRYALSKAPPRKKPIFYKLEIDPSARLELLSELHRMNINSASLFPGLDGFSRYLRTSILINAILRSPQLDNASYQAMAWAETHGPTHSDKTT
jgi:hypothetical protein